MAVSSLLQNGSRPKNQAPQDMPVYTDLVETKKGNKVMSDAGGFSRSVSVAKNVCPDCGQRMERKENGSFAVGDEKYRCINPQCPGKTKGEQYENHDGRRTFKI